MLSKFLNVEPKLLMYKCFNFFLKSTAFLLFSNISLESLTSFLKRPPIINIFSSFKLVFLYVKLQFSLSTQINLLSLKTKTFNNKSLMH